MYKFGSFRPSDRSEILECLKVPDGNQIFVDAVIEYLKRWQRADWIECYNVERIATWVAKNTPEETREELNKRLKRFLERHPSSDENAYHCFSNSLKQNVAKADSSVVQLM